MTIILTIIAAMAVTTPLAEILAAVEVMVEEATDEIITSSTFSSI